MAVFLAYLHNCERNADLASLVGEPSFGQWLIKRIRLSFQTPQIEQKLAFLIAQFPLNDAVAETIYRGDYHQLFNNLANDGWIEQEELPMDLSNDRTWVAIHDVLADQILTHYLEGNSKTTELFVCELLEFAVQVGSLRSTLYTLQRLIGLPQLNRLDWLKILNQQMLRAPLAWKETRDVLIRNSLLSSIQTLSLLDRHEPVWEDIETEVDFQNYLAWNIRQYLSEADSHSDNSISLTLIKWIEKAIPQISRTNLLLNWGLKLCPEIVQTAALNWITNYPRKFQTHYLLVAWLESHLPTEAISFAVQQWCDQFPLDAHLSFVYKSWLDTGGEKERIQSHLFEWLVLHATALEADFVYKSWLNARGDLELIRSPLIQWLEQNQEHPEIDYICRAWLKSGGEFEIVREASINWFNRSWQNENAVFLMQSLLTEWSLPFETLTCALKWCQKFPNNPNSLARFNRLGSRLFQDELAEDVYLAAEAILTLLIDRKDLLERVQAQIYRTFSFVVAARSLQTEIFQDKVDYLFIRWLKNPISFGGSIAHIKIQRLSYFQIFSNLIIRGKLNIEQDRDCLERFLKWINLWESNNKEAIRKSLDYLKDNYPNPDLWQIVQFESES
ncbi:MAG: hypothetical protein ACK5RE_20270 [Pseudanabaena sp.]